MSTSRANSMNGPDRRGPRALGDVLGELFAARGYARLRGVAALEEAWAAAVGEKDARRTKVGAVRRGVLGVTVGHPALLEELAAFRKPALLEALRQRLPDAGIHDVRFRIGPVDEPPTQPAPRRRPPAGANDRD